MVETGEEAIGGGRDVVVQGQHVVCQAIDLSLSFSRGELDAKDVFQEWREEAGDGSDSFCEDSHALIKADQAFGLGLDIQVNFDEPAVNSDSVFVGVSYRGGNEHEPTG